MEKPGYSLRTTHVILTGEQFREIVSVFEVIVSLKESNRGYIAPDIARSMLNWMEDHGLLNRHSYPLEGYKKPELPWEKEKK